MPPRNSLISRLCNRRAWDEWDERGDSEITDAVVPATESDTPRSRRRRVAIAFVFAALFVAGAAFSAAAGDQVRSTLEDSAASGLASTDGTTTGSSAPASTDPTTTDPATTNPVADDVGGGIAGTTPVDSGSSGSTPDTAAPPATSAPATAPATAAPVTAPPTAVAAAVQQAATRSGSVTRVGTPANPASGSQGGFAATTGTQAHHLPKGAPAPHAAPPELDGATSAVVWLNRAMPDPTPPALRLKTRFATQLKGVARANHVSWALMLGVLRAEGRNGDAPANLRGLRSIATRLSQLGVQNASPWAAMFSLSSNASFADRAVALSHYYRAVGLRALVSGLVAEKARLGTRVLNDPRVSIYAGGRGDIESGRVNVRVLAVIEYLADSFGQVTVSCLISGHRLYARPGVISAHIYGLAADISEVGGVSITGHQQPGGITERAVRDVLLLPPEMMPKQVISLLGLGGPSFPLADHYNHIHIGY
jgi:hypothetical protein